MSDEEKLTDHEAGAQFIVVDQGYQVAPQPQVKISEDEKTGEINDYWRMERFRDYTFKICLNDRHESRRLRNQKFSVNSFQGKKREYHGRRWLFPLDGDDRIQLLCGCHICIT